MAAWKQQLRRSASAEGHRLMPIARVSPKPKGKALAEQPNSYSTACPHCILRIEISTRPGFPAMIKYRLGDRPIVDLSACTPARYKAAEQRFFNREQAATQQEAAPSEPPTTVN